MFVRIEIDQVLLTVGMSYNGYEVPTLPSLKYTYCIRWLLLVSSSYRLRIRRRVDYGTYYLYEYILCGYVLRFGFILKILKSRSEYFEWIHLRLYKKQYEGQLIMTPRSHRSHYLVMSVMWLKRLCENPLCVLVCIRTYRYKRSPGRIFTRCFFWACDGMVLKFLVFGSERFQMIRVAFLRVVRLASSEFEGWQVWICVKKGV